MNAENVPQVGTAYEPADYIERLLADAELFSVAVVAGPLDAPVAACPGWDLEQLTRHMAHIHRWATHCVEHGERPAEGTIAEPAAGLDGPALATWLLDGAATLAHALRTTDPQQPTWHPFPVPLVTSVWARRQAHETSVHRWDAQHAVGDADGIDPAFAGDGIDEFFTIALPRTVIREQIAPPAGSVHVHCTDVDGEWLAWFDDDGYHVIPEHRKGDAALRGPAEQVLLALYHRDGDRSDLSPVGDSAVLDAWFNLPGL
ncbi:MAG TPA: maleylpyruvate isomerase family mycothiol-dependent enzyme [Ilumatobacter sp.]|nr:maleylpyruvate isomerase family mycothiol-dependent enzyme [Ilumatobacter sp.]